MIRIEGLTWARQKMILDHVDLQVRSDAMSILIGPNGAGKTTLLKIMSGLIGDYRGNVYINDRNIKHFKRRELAAYISFQPQSEEFLLPFRVRDILLSGRYPYKKLFSDYDESDRDIYARCVQKFNIGDLVDRDINSLSSGEKRKVLIASAYIQDVPLLLFDEPFSNLDPEGIMSLKKVFKELRDEGKTLLIVSHTLEPIFAMADDLIAIRAGRILYSGSKEAAAGIMDRTFNMKFDRISHKDSEIFIPDENQN